MRILFSTNPLAGHFYPLVPLAWAARSLGHEVVVSTSDSFVPAVLRSGLPAISVGPAGGVADMAAAGVADRRKVHGRTFARIALRNFAGVESLVRTWEPDLVVSERAEFTGPVVAAAHGVPHVEFHWGVPELPEYRAAGAAALAGHLATAGLAGLPEAPLTIDPWPPSLRLPHAAWHQGLRYVPYDGDARVPHWALAPRSRSRVCLTLGTVVPHLGEGAVTEVVLPVLHRLAALDVELVLAIEDEVVAGWPELPSAVRHAGRLPLSHVLAGSDLIVNHGGQGTTLAALHAGVPQLVLPQYDDHFDNADAVVRAEAGIRLLPEEITPDRVAEHCADLLGDRVHRDAARAVAAEIAAQPSAADVVGLLAGHVAAHRRRPGLRPALAA